MAVPITFKFDASDIRSSAEETLQLISGSTEGVAEVMKDVMDRVEDVMEGVGRDVSADLKKTISIPVVRQGAKVIRSKPGEPPRKDTGRLYNSVRYVVYRAGVDITNVVITTETPYDVFVNATRPFQAIIEAKWEGIINQRIQFSELSTVQFSQ